MLPLYNDQISLLTVLAVYTCLLYNGHLSITTTETSSPKWSLYTSLTVHQFFTIFKFQFSEAKNFVRSLQKVVNQSKNVCPTLKNYPNQSLFCFTPAYFKHPRKNIMTSEKKRAESKSLHLLNKQA